MITLSLFTIMLTSCEQKIVDLLLPSPYSHYSIREISRRIKTSYALVHASINQLQHKGLIKVTQTGKSQLCRVNLSVDPQILAMAAMENAQQYLKKAKFSFVINDLKEKLSDFMYIMLVFGSQAKGTATSKSDVDLFFAVQHEQDIETVKRKINTVLSSTALKIDAEVVTTAWLLQMFNEKNSVGREVLEHSVVLHGAEHYYTLVRKHDQQRGH